MCSNAGGGSQILYMQLPLDGQDGGAHVALSIHTRTYVYIYASGTARISGCKSDRGLTIHTRVVFFLIRRAYV